MTIHVPGRATNTTDQRDAARLAAASAVTRTVPDDEQAGALREVLDMLGLLTSDKARRTA